MLLRLTNMMWIRLRLIKQILGNLWISNNASQVTTLWNNYQSLIFFQLFNNKHSTLHSMNTLSLEFSLVKAKIGTKTIKMSSYDIAMIKLILSTSIRRYTQFNIYEIGVNLSNTIYCMLNCSWTNRNEVINSNMHNTSDFIRKSGDKRITSLLS